MEMKILNLVYHNTTALTLADVYHCFGRNYRLHLHNRSEKDEVCLPQLLFATFQMKRCHSP